jgi:hypothetical protein
MGYDRKYLKETMKPHYGFDGKRTEHVGVITLPFSFGTPQNPRTEYITFDVVDMLYPYNTIFRRDLLNTFEVVLHFGYLCLKIPTTFNIISVFGSQKDSRNIEQGFAPGHKNVHFLREEAITPNCRKEIKLQELINLFNNCVCCISYRCIFYCVMKCSFILYCV